MNRCMVLLVLMAVIISSKDGSSRVLAWKAGGLLQTTHQQQLLKQLKSAAATTVISFLIPFEPSWAGMLTFPLPAPLKNNIVLVRSGESFADARHEIETNPVKKLQQNNGLTPKGRDEMLRVAETLEAMDFSPSFIWASNTERAYESARVLAEDLKLGQNRIVPEYSFLDARAMGTFEGQNDEATWAEIHKQDALVGTSYKPPPANDGTPSESVSDVLVRANQLVSTIESMYSGENVLIIAPDSDNLSVLLAALSDENPDASLPKHARFAMKNGEVRKLDYLVKPSELLVTGQTQAEADKTFRQMKALRITAGPGGAKAVDDWIDLWKISVDNSNGG